MKLKQLAKKSVALLSDWEGSLLAIIHVLYILGLIPKRAFGVSSWKEEKPNALGRVKVENTHLWIQR